MFVHMSIHNPKPEYEDALRDSMHRFGAACRTQPGLQQVHTLKDKRSGVLIGLAIWDSEEAMMAARPAMAAAVVNDDFDTWEAAPVQFFLLEDV